MSLPALYLLLETSILDPYSMWGWRGGKDTYCRPSFDGFERKLPLVAQPLPLLRTEENFSLLADYLVPKCQQGLIPCHPAWEQARIKGTAQHLQPALLTECCVRQARATEARKLVCFNVHAQQGRCSHMLMSVCTRISRSYQLAKGCKDY